MIKNGEISFIVNTVEDDAHRDRRLALDPHHGAAQRVTYYTTIAGAQAPPAPA